MSELSIQEARLFRSNFWHEFWTTWDQDHGMGMIDLSADYRSYFMRMRGMRLGENPADFAEIEHQVHVALTTERQSARVMTERNRLIQELESTTIPMTWQTRLEALLDTIENRDGYVNRPHLRNAFIH